MKEFIDKLISRLNKKARWVAYSAWDRDIGMTHKVVPFSDLREIVNELAEEYKGKKVNSDLISRSETIKELNEIYLDNPWDDKEDILEKAIGIVEHINCSINASIDCSTKVSEMPTGSEDCCEWVLIDYEANVYDTTCRNPHILLEGSPTDNSYEFCPYCGKKIKVAPYTEGE